MPFVARFNGKGLVVPVRTYLHEAGYELWQNGNNSITNAKRYAQKIFKSDEFRLLAKEEELDYAIAALWGDNGKKTADVFGYSGLREDWKFANPEVISLNCVDGTWQSPARFCGDMDILRGDLEKWRRASTGDLDYFINHDPGLSSMIWKPIHER